MTVRTGASFAEARTVLALGRNATLLIAHNTLGTSTWTWGAGAVTASGMSPASAWAAAATWWRPRPTPVTWDRCCHRNSTRPCRAPSASRHPALHDGRARDLHPPDPAF